MLKNRNKKCCQVTHFDSSNLNNIFYERVLFCFDSGLPESVDISLISWDMSDVKRKRNSRPEVLAKKSALKKIAKFTGKHLCWSLFLIKLQT